MANLTYEQFKQKIAATLPRNADIEEILRAVYTSTGPITWDSDGEVVEGGAIKQVAITTNYTAEAWDFITATASTANITVTLPSAADNKSKSIYIHKADATEWKIVVTGVKDISFQNSTMHLISNGTEWVIS